MKSMVKVAAIILQMNAMYFLLKLKQTVTAMKAASAMVSPVVRIYVSFANFKLFCISELASR